MKTKLIKQFLIAALSLNFIASTFAANRIADILSNPEAKKLYDTRCVSRGVSPEKCSKIQKSALASGCITQEEYDLLIGENYIPICSNLGVEPNGNPEDAFSSLCPCGCFHPDTRILTMDTFTNSAFDVRAADLAHLSSKYNLVNLGSSTRSHRFTLNQSPIHRVTQGSESKPLVVIEAENGRVLKLTEQHAVLTGSGRMIAAKNITTTDRLVNTDGTTLAITQITRETFDGKVYNFLTKGTEALSHVIFAEGFAVGDLAWQNSLQDELNAVLVRE